MLLLCIINAGLFKLWRNITSTKISTISRFFNEEQNGTYKFIIKPNYNNNNLFSL